MNAKLSENYRGGVFPDEETFQKIYSESLENAPMAPEKLRNAYSEMGDWFEAYIGEIEEHTFRYAYQCGYKAGQEGDMIELRRNELRLDEVVLRYATDQEIRELREIAKAIAERVKRCGGAAA